MRVLMVSTDGSLFDEGSPARIRHRAYARCFDALHVLCVAKGPLSAVRDGNLTIYPSSPPAPFFRNLSRRLRAAYSVAGIISRYNIDVVSVQDPFEIGLAAVVGMMGMNAKLYVQVHTDFLSPEYAQLSIVNRLRVLIAGYVLRRASRIRVVSSRLKVALQTRYRLVIPITVLPIFGDPDRFRTASVDPELSRRFEKFKTKVLVVSRLESEKNVVLALRSFASAALPDSCFIILGTGRQREALEAAARALRVSDRVFFEGTANPLRYYPIADIVLVPSKYEGYGLVIVEALAAGKPVLSTDVGIAREAGAIVTTEDRFADSLAEWFKSGPRIGTLKNYPYKNFDEYVRAYCDDIIACVKGK